MIRVVSTHSKFKQKSPRTSTSSSSSISSFFLNWFLLFTKQLITQTLRGHNANEISADDELASSHDDETAATLHFQRLF